MIGTNFMDEIDCGSFFDHMDDLLEFPSDDFEIVGNGNTSINGSKTTYDYGDAFPNGFWGDAAGNSPDTLPADSVFSGNNSASDLSAEISVPYEDIVQLEWLSTFVEDSFSAGGMTMKKDQNSFSSTRDSSSHNQFRTSSPVSVLESSSSSTNGNGNANAANTLPVTHEKRARSKRPRPPTFTPRPSMHHLISFPTPANSDGSLFVPISSFDSYHYPSKKTCARKEKPQFRVCSVDEPKKKTKIKILPPSPHAEHGNQNQNPNPGSPNPATQGGPVRKCMHCEITKTPQWRAGPMGPKTLCNACGVRYKSGRLYPEYRPAASPTFSPSLHSNSHKKVLEMRNKGTDEDVPETVCKINVEKPVATQTTAVAAACAAPLAAAAAVLPTEQVQAPEPAPESVPVAVSSILQPVLVPKSDLSDYI